MTLLKPTLEEVYEKNNKRLQELAEREALWHKKRKYFIRKTALTSAIILPISARMMAFGGGMSWIAYILFFCMGGLLGYLIAKYSIGMLRSMFLYLGGAFPVFLLCFVCGWWGGASASGFMGVGPIILMIMGWLGWIIVGAILGFISDTHENDTVQI